jgi:hypothetical protein
MDIKIKEEDKNNLTRIIIELINLSLKTKLIDEEVLHNITYDNK